MTLDGEISFWVDAATGIVVATGASSDEGKYRFVGVPTTNFNLEVEETGKFKRSTYIDVIKRIEGVRVYQGLNVPVNLTVEYPQAPAVAYGVEFMPPTLEYRKVTPAPYMGVAPTKAKRIFA